MMPLLHPRYFTKNCFGLVDSLLRNEPNHTACVVEPPGFDAAAVLAARLAALGTSALRVERTDDVFAALASRLKDPVGKVIFVARGVEGRLDELRQLCIVHASKQRKDELGARHAGFFPLSFGKMHALYHPEDDAFWLLSTGRASFLSTADAREQPEIIRVRRDGGMDLVLDRSAMILPAAYDYGDLTRGTFCFFHDREHRRVGLALAGFGKTDRIAVGFVGEGNEALTATESPSAQPWDKLDALFFDPLRARLTHYAVRNRRLEAWEQDAQGVWQRADQLPGVDTYVALRVGWDGAGQRAVVVAHGEASNCAYAWDGKRLTKLGDLPHPPQKGWDWSTQTFTRLPGSEALLYLTAERNQVKAYLLRGAAWSHHATYALEQTGTGVFDPRERRAVLLGAASARDGYHLFTVLPFAADGAPLPCEASVPLLAGECFDNGMLVAGDHIVTYEQTPSISALRRLAGATAASVPLPAESLLSLVSHQGVPCAVTVTGALLAVDGDRPRELSPPAFPKRVGSAVAADGARIWVIGGTGMHDDVELKETWLLENGQWRELPGKGPVGTSAVAAFDAKRSRVVCWGGLNEDDKRVWEHDGKKWTKYVAVVADKPVESHSAIRLMAYDDASAQVFAVRYEYDMPTLLVYRGRGVWQPLGHIKGDISGRYAYDAACREVVEIRGRVARYPVGARLDEAAAGAGPAPKGQADRGRKKTPAVRLKGLSPGVAAFIKAVEGHDQLAATYREGASPDALAALRQEFPQLPETLVQLFRWADGQNGVSPLIEGHSASLSSIESMRGERRLWLGFARELEAMPAGERRRRFHFAFFHDSWLPFASSEHDVYALALEPCFDGPAGQVISYDYKGGSSWHVESESLDAWLATRAKICKTGVSERSTDAAKIKKRLNPRERHVDLPMDRLADPARFNGIVRAQPKAPTLAECLQALCTAPDQCLPKAVEASLEALASEAASAVVGRSVAVMAIGAYGRVGFHQVVTVVEQSTDPLREIAHRDAKLLDPDCELGDQLCVDIDTAAVPGSDWRPLALDRPQFEATLLTALLREGMIR